MNVITHLMAALAAYSIEALKRSAFKLFEKKRAGNSQDGETLNGGSQWNMSLFQAH